MSTYGMLLGVLVDMFGQDATRLNLNVRFVEPRKSSDGIIESRSAKLFGSLFLNQLKVSLSILGIGLASLNILPKESLDKLLFIAVGCDDSEERIQLLADFWEVYKGTYRVPLAGGVVAVKLYVVQQGHIFSNVTSFPADREGVLTNIGDLLHAFSINGTVLTQGVKLNHQTPLHFLRNECYYADGFVHLVIFPK